VLYANAHPSMAHSGPDFIPVFGDCIRMLRWIICAASTPQLTPVQRSSFHQGWSTIPNRRQWYAWLGPGCGESRRTWRRRRFPPTSGRSAANTHFRLWCLIRDTLETPSLNGRHVYGDFACHPAQCCCSMQLRNVRGECNPSNSAPRRRSD